MAMANLFPQDIKITMRLRIKEKLINKDKKLIADISCDTEEMEQFIEELSKLCQKYNYYTEATLNYESDTENIGGN